MRSWSLTIRLGLAFAACTLIAFGASILFYQSVLQQSLLNDTVEQLVTPQRAEPEYVTSEKLQEMGVSPQDIQTFIDSKAIDIGFIVKAALGSQLVYVYKTEDKRLAAISHGAGAIEAYKRNWKTLFFALFGAFGITFVLSLVFTRLGLQPLASLRKATEDILAGRFEIVMKYGANDDLGRSVEALQRLCTELELRSKALEKVSELATTDGMTGLKNHRAFKEEFERQVSQAIRHKRPLGLILMDVDHFKKFNDTYGHQQGDEVLRTVGATLKLTIRKSDFVARYGGEEFVTILPETNLEGVRLAAEKLRESIQSARVKNLNANGEQLAVTASFGAVCINFENLKPGKESTELTQYIELCDQNLYKGKKAGRNCVIASEFPSVENKDMVA